MENTSSTIDNSTRKVAQRPICWWSVLSCDHKTIRYRLSKRFTGRAYPNAAINDQRRIICNKKNLWRKQQPNPHLYPLPTTILSLPRPLYSTGERVGCCCERAHLLSDVIQNLQMDSDFYCKRTISYKLKKGAPLENIIGSYLSSKEWYFTDTAFSFIVLVHQSNVNK